MPALNSCSESRCLCPELSVGREQGRSHLSSDHSLCPSLPGPPTVREPAQPKATWSRGQGGPAGLASSPAPCPLRRPASSSLGGPAGPWAPPGEQASRRARAFTEPPPPRAGHGAGDQHLRVPVHPAPGPGGPRVRAGPLPLPAAARRLRPRAREPSGRARPAFHALASAASCASYSFSLLSPQGLSLAPQGPSSPFWPGTAALGAWGTGPPAGPQPPPGGVRGCLWRVPERRAREGAAGGLAGGTGGHSRAWLGAALLAAMASPLLVSHCPCQLCLRSRPTARRPPSGEAGPRSGRGTWLQGNRVSVAPTPWPPSATVRARALPSHCACPHSPWSLSPVCWDSWVLA